MSLEMIVFMGSSSQKGGKWHRTQKISSCWRSTIFDHLPPFVVEGTIIKTTSISYFMPPPLLKILDPPLVLMSVVASYRLECEVSEVIVSP